MDGSRSPSRLPKRSRGSWKAWSVKDEAILKEMAGKHSTEEIAKRLGRTPSAVSHRAHRLGISLSMRELDPMMIDMARALSAAGYTPTQIIHAFNVPAAEAKAIKRDLANYQPPRTCKGHGISRSRV